MKTNVINSIIALTLSIFLFACNDDDTESEIMMEEETMNIVETASSTNSLSSLVAALTKADESSSNDLITALSDETVSYTVLAPTNEAFNELLARLDGFDSLDDFNTEQLQDLLAVILKYHVVAGASVTSTDLTEGQAITTLQGETINVSLDGGVFFIDAAGESAEVTAADIETNNGTVHLIDKILLPQAAIDALSDILLMSITDLAIATPGLENLVTALIAANGDLPTVLKGDGPFTVFAPTNEAFEAFLESNNFTDLNSVPVDVLTQILMNHVVSGEFLSTSLETGYISSLSTSGVNDTNLSMFINVSDGVIINGISNVTAADNKALNGVVHVVDAVIGLPTVVTFAAADETFNPLVSALTVGTPNTDFVSVLNGEGPFTVFAPTNTAFQTLLDSNTNWNTVTDIDETLLTSVLNHHVLSGNVRSEDLTDGIAPTTLEGDNITINLPGTGNNIADITDGSSNTGIGVIAVDVQATNGVIHVLNTVMIPDTTN